MYVSGALSPLYHADGSLIGYVKMARDLTDRKIMEQRLNTANRRKDEFIAMLSHELRNPLTPVRNSLQILKMTLEGNSSLMPLIVMMTRQIDRTVVLVNDLLDVSRISKGKVKFRMTHIVLQEVILESLEIARPVFENTGRILHINIPDEPIYIRGDVSRLIQVLHNIFNNAVKYTHEDGQVWLKVGQSEDKAEISIRDDGVGIEEKTWLTFLKALYRSMQPLTVRRVGLDWGYRWSNSW